ncbi:MAG: PspC domain-containing protein [Bacteroidota bacterium]|nr:PspC domain-containing protein [Bacteroidota bacterium]MDP4274019.1 PspC domain-containing protein [Bacteroidota bacterium]
MKTTLTVNLNQLIFNIDEDAYRELETYLGSIEERLDIIAEKQEILKDIESRIAEIFQQKLRKGKEVINIEDVQEVIKTIGSPEEFGEGGNFKQPEAQSTKPYKRMYRDPDNRVLGGVCGGIGAFWNFDPIFMRILFIILFLLYGSGLLIYLLMWIIIPEAKTPEQKEEMRGQAPSFQDIKKNVSKEFKNIKKKNKL